MTPDSRKPGLIFVGSFSIGPGGLVGGTYSACKQLMESQLPNVFEVTTLDTSQLSVSATKIWHRLVSGVGRLLRVLKLAASGRCQTALIFATLGPSWIERGLLALVCRMFGMSAFIFARCAEVNFEIEQKPFVRAFTRFLLRRGVHLIFQGSILRDRAVAVYPWAAGKMYAIPNWIDLRWCDGVASVPSGKPTTILYMGWLHPLKGVDILIEGLSRHAEMFRDCRFVLCGDGVDRSMLTEMASRSGVEIEFRGWTLGEAKKAAFSEAQIVILPSRVEGMPNVLLEAMSVARPVVATTVGSVADLIDSGVEGLLVPPEIPDALVTALSALLADPNRSRQMGIAGKARIERDHSLQTASQRLIDLLLTL